LKTKAGEAEALSLQTILSIKQRHFKTGERNIKRAINFFEKLHRRLDLAKCYFYYSQLLSAKGDSPQAKQYCKKALAVFSKLGARYWMNCLKKQCP
jgi:tetratricopeptide (TPR) repeat protein